MMDEDDRASQNRSMRHVKELIPELVQKWFIAE